MTGELVLGKNRERASVLLLFRARDLHAELLARISDHVIDLS